jgi:hypothetical protein
MYPLKRLLKFGHKNAIKYVNRGPSSPLIFAQEEETRVRPSNEFENDILQSFDY